MPTKTAAAPSATKYQADLADQLVAVEAQIAELAAEQAELRAKLVKSIGNGNSVETPVARLTVTDSTSTIVDFETLVSTHPVWARRVTTKVLDLAKFKGLLVAKAVPQDILDLVSYKTGNPFLRVTHRPQEDAA